jgi:hypothetical protein
MESVKHTHFKSLFHCLPGKSLPARLGRIIITQPLANFFWNLLKAPNRLIRENATKKAQRKPNMLPRED